jgi:hypothetical protein
MFKNLEFRYVLVGLFVSSIYNITRLTHLLHIRRPTAALAILRGDSWVLHNLSSIIAKRTRIQHARKVSDRSLLEQGLMMRLIDGLREFTRLTGLLNI